MQALLSHYFAYVTVAEWSIAIESARGVTEHTKCVFESPPYSCSGDAGFGNTGIVPRVAVDEFCLHTVLRRGSTEVVR